ncbi:TolB family protein [Actinoplanes sp. NPDC049668]|uniref:TolB family protein n=1 Tax=unclassified Actinoplanes TaxID=2626549 RepID=UPI0033BB62D1
MRPRTFAAAAGVLSAGVAMACLATNAFAAENNSTARVNVSHNGTQPGGAAAGAVSADGRFVAFTSRAGNLVAGDTNRAEDVFVRDLVARTTTRVSVSGAGAQVGGNSYAPSISDDGRYVSFASDAADLVAGDSNGRRDVFVRDLTGATTTRVSLAPSGAQGTRDSAKLSKISADGRYVTFQSTLPLADGDEAGGAERENLFVRDLTAGTTVRVNVTRDGLRADVPDADSYEDIDGGLSAVVGGRYVTFEALTSQGSSLTADVHLRDLATGTTTPVSVHRVGPKGTLHSVHASMSADGRYVAFSSWASDLVEGDTNRREDVFIRDLSAGTTTLVSVSGAGAQGDLASIRPAISPDGRYVAYLSYARNLVSGDTNNEPDVFVRDLVAGSTTRVSVSDIGEQADGLSANPSISSFGRRVTFESTAANLVPGDANVSRDVFVHTLAD